MGLLRALTENEAETAVDHEQARLRGRTYAIPFDEVWRAALGILEGRWRWKLIHVDDQEGIIKAEATTLVWRMVDDVEIRITLDENAQTRVDLRSASRKGFADFGTNARRIGRFLRKLDRTILQNRRQRTAAQRAA